MKTLICLSMLFFLGILGSVVEDSLICTPVPVDCTVDGECVSELECKWR
jgi:hypothetical protein